MNTLTPEPYRPNHCGGMALFFEEGLKSGCDQLDPEFARKACAEVAFDHEGEHYSIRIERTRTCVAWSQAASSSYQVTMQNGNTAPLVMSFSSSTRPDELNRDLVDKLAYIFPDFPVPADLM